MKNLIVLFVLLVSFSSCSKDDDNKSSNKDSELIGKWKLIKIGSGDASGTLHWVDVQDGDIIIFSENSSYKSDEFTACQNEGMNSGFYTTEKNTENGELENIVYITIENCPNKPDNMFVRSSFYRFDEKNLILMPKDPGCFEGCEYVYESVKQ